MCGEFFKSAFKKIRVKHVLIDTVKRELQSKKIDFNKLRQSELAKFSFV